MSEEPTYQRTYRTAEFFDHTGLPFADALTAEQMQQAFDDEGVSFGQNDHEANVSSANAEDDDGIVYTPAVMLWAMLSQALFTGVQRSCRAAVQRVAVYYALLGREVSSTNTGAYCRARAKVTEGVIQRLTEGSHCDVKRPVRSPRPAPSPARPTPPR